MSTFAETLLAARDAAAAAAARWDARHAHAVEAATKRLPTQSLTLTPRTGCDDCRPELGLRCAHHRALAAMRQRQNNDDARAYWHWQQEQAQYAEGE